MIYIKNVMGDENMKKSMLNVITLALVLINLVLTVILTFSLVSTNNKTNSLISKVSDIIDLDTGNVSASDGDSDKNVSLDDIEYVDITNNDSADITISYTDTGKTHYVVLNVTVGVDKTSKDYETKINSLKNGMKVIVSEVTTEALKYQYSEITAHKTTIESNLLTYLKDQFQSDMIYSVTLTKILVQ